MAGAVKHRGPAQIHALDNDVILLRQVDFKRLGPNIVDMLRRTDLRPGEKEGDMPWFLDGYVSVEQPRDMPMSEALLKATIGYALARTDTGEILAEFERDQFARASKIQEKSQSELAVQILLEDEEGEAD
jgi:hypothetical protein